MPVRHGSGAGELHISRDRKIEICKNMQIISRFVTCRNNMLTMLNRCVCKYSRQVCQRIKMRLDGGGELSPETIPCGAFRYKDKRLSDGRSVRSRVKSDCISSNCGTKRPNRTRLHRAKS